MADDVGLPCLVLNDAVAFALGCPVMRVEAGPQTVLCLTLGTYFGCALLRSSATVQPVEVDDCLPNFAWPGGVSGSPTAALHFHKQRNSKDDQAYSQLVGWLIGALQRELGRLPVVLGGGGARSVQIEQVLLSIPETGGASVDVRVEADNLTGLAGAARLWQEVVERRRPIQELVAALTSTIKRSCAHWPGTKDAPAPASRLGPSYASPRRRGDPPGPTAPPYAARRCVARRLFVNSGRKRARSVPLLATLNI